MATLRKRGKNWYFRFVDRDGVKRERKGCTDRRVTEELARAAESKAAKIRAGESDPKADRMIHEGPGPSPIMFPSLSPACDRREMTRSIVNRPQRAYIDRDVTLAKVKRIADLTPSGIAEALTVLKADGLSHRAVNAHATAIKSLSRWLQKDGRTADYALAIVAKLDEKADRRYVRRPLNDKELRKLIETARTAPDWRGMSGVERSWFYTLGAMTGLRRSELGTSARGLRPGRFDAGCPP